MTLNFAQASLPQLYERELVGPLFRPWASLILDDVRLAPGDRVLEVACGTGVVSRLARTRVGQDISLVAVDLSPAMLGIAREVAPDIDFREGDAAALPLREGEQFDVVICQQGLQFFTDREGAVREMHRALVPNGRLAVSTWRPDDEVPYGRELRRIVEGHVGPVSDRRHSFGDAGPLAALFRDAGFQDVRVRTVSQTVRFSDGMIFVRLNAMALVSMSAASRTFSDHDRERVMAGIMKESEDVTRRYSDANGLAFDISANVLTARR